MLPTFLPAIVNFMGYSIVFLFTFIICCYGKAEMIRSAEACLSENEACFHYTFKSIEGFREQLRNDGSFKKYLRKHMVHQSSKMKNNLCSQENTTPKTSTEFELLDLPFSDGACTYLSSKIASYSMAEKNCQKISENSKLASNRIKDGSIHSLGYLSERYWTGLRRNANNEWFWSDGTISDQSNTKWLGERPVLPKPPSFNGYDCAALNIARDFLIDLPCREKNKFLCQHNMHKNL